MRNKDSGQLIKASTSSPRPNPSGHGRFVNDRTGEVRMMSCGQTATIIVYRSNLDIDVQFEDGAVVTNKQYESFKLGYIKHPNHEISGIYKRRNDLREKRIGKSKVMNNGMHSTIIGYRNIFDIDIQYEDGVIIKGICYSSWVKGEIKHPTIKSLSQQKVSEEDLKGQINTMSNGMQATIIAARSIKDVDVQFEDGNIVEHAAYSSFKSGHICHPDKKGNRLGETRMMNCGMECTIIAYEDRRHICVKFKDGTRVVNKTYHSFQNGLIRNPSVKRTYKKRNNKEQQRQKTTQT